MLAARVARLAAEKRRLESDAEVERIARDDLGMVRPGETAFVVAASPRPGAAVPPKGPATARRPWYSRWWHAVFGVSVWRGAFSATGR
ncbi:MAG: septum formation initiator family protein [Acidobacteria bacterium]|nr:septum formation initiator family protein [Acidobacteriota bacterium]